MYVGSTSSIMPTYSVIFIAVWEYEAKKKKNPGVVE